MTTNKLMVFSWSLLPCTRVEPEIGVTLLDPLNAELNPICHLLALLGAHHILHISRIRVNSTSVLISFKCPFV
jgi:hypothetical protein